MQSKCHIWHHLQHPISCNQWSCIIIVSVRRAHLHSVVHASYGTYLIHTSAHLSWACAQVHAPYALIITYGIHFSAHHMYHMHVHVQGTHAYIHVRINVHVYTLYMVILGYWVMSQWLDCHSTHLYTSLIS